MPVVDRFAEQAKKISDFQHAFARFSIKDPKTPEDLSNAVIAFHKLLDNLIAACTAAIETATGPELKLLKETNKILAAQKKASPASVKELNEAVLEAQQAITRPQLKMMIAELESGSEPGTVRDAQLAVALRTALDSLAKGSVTGSALSAGLHAIKRGAVFSTVGLARTVSASLASEPTKTLSESEMTFLATEHAKLPEKDRAKKLKAAQDLNLKLQSATIGNLLKSPTLWQILDIMKPQIVDIILLNPDKLGNFLKELIEDPSAVTLNSQLALAEIVLSNPEARTAISSILKSAGGEVLLTRILTAPAVKDLITSLGYNAEAIIKAIPQIAKLLPALLDTHGERLAELMPIAKKVLLATSPQEKSLSPADLNKISVFAQELLNDPTVTTEASELVVDLVQAQLSSTTFNRNVAEAGLNHERMRDSVTEIMPLVPILVSNHGTKVAELVSIARTALGTPITKENLETSIRHLQAIVTDPALTAVPKMIGKLVNGQLNSILFTRIIKALGVEDAEERGAVLALVEPVLTLGLTVLQKFPISEILSSEHATIYTDLANNIRQKLSNPDFAFPELTQDTMDAIRQDVTRWVGDTTIMSMLHDIVVSINKEPTITAIKKILTTIGIAREIVDSLPKTLALAESVLSRGDALAAAVQGVGMMPLTPDKASEMASTAASVMRHTSSILADATVASTLKDFLKEMLVQQIDTNPTIGRYVSNKEQLKALLDPALKTVISAVQNLDVFSDIIATNGAKYLDIVSRSKNATPVSPFKLTDADLGLIAGDASKILKSEGFNLNDLFKQPALVEVMQGVISSIQLGDKEILGVSPATIKQIISEMIPVAIGALNFITDKGNLITICTNIVDALPTFLDEKVSDQKKADLLFKTADNIVKIFGDTGFSFSPGQNSSFFGHIFNGVNQVVSKHPEEFAKMIKAAARNIKGKRFDIDGETVVGIIKDRKVFAKMYEAYTTYRKGGVVNLLTALVTAFTISIRSEHARVATAAFISHLWQELVVPNFMRRLSIGTKIEDICSAPPGKDGKRKDLATRFNDAYDKADRTDVITRYSLQNKVCAGLRFNAETLSNCKMVGFNFQKVVFGMDASTTSFAGSSIKESDFTNVEFRSELDLSNVVIDVQSLATMVRSLDESKHPPIRLNGTRLASLEISEEDRAKIMSSKFGKENFEQLQINTIQHQLTKTQKDIAPEKMDQLARLIISNMKDMQPGAVRYVTAMLKMPGIVNTLAKSATPEDDIRALMQQAKTAPTPTNSNIRVPSPPTTGKAV